VKTLDVSATGGTVGTYTHDTTGTDLTNMVWTPETYTFLATSASTTLTFTSTTAGAYGPALDAVVVSESVPTLSDCKEGGWQTMIDNAGNSFKNQGDCVSYFATKGKNLGAVAPAAAADTVAADTATADTGASDTDQAASPTKHPARHHDKVTDRHVTQRHDAKDKNKTHGGGHGSHHST
jgi:hypothetical protein